jgi:hypothetical protein
MEPVKDTSIKNPGMVSNNIPAANTPAVVDSSVKNPGMISNNIPAANKPAVVDSSSKNPGMVSNNIPAANKPAIFDSSTKNFGQTKGANENQTLNGVSVAVLAQQALDKANANYGKKILGTVDPSDKAHPNAIYVGDGKTQTLGDQPVGGRSVITNGGLGVGDPVTQRGSTVWSQPHVKVDKKPVVVSEPKGKIKYIYSILNAENGRDLYVGGWQRQSKFIGTFPARGVLNLSSLVTASIDNLGGDNYETNITQIIADGNTTYPGQSGTYGFDIISLEKNGQQIGQFGLSTLLDDNGDFNQSSHKGFGFYHRGNYRFFEGGIDKFFGLQNSEETERTLYSLAFYNGTRITGAASTYAASVGTGDAIIGTWEYALLPRQGTPFFITNNNNASVLTESGITGSDEYSTFKINRAGNRGLGYYLNPGYTAASVKPSWYNDEGISVASDNTFDVFAKINENYIDLAEADDRFYLFSKTDFDGSRDRKITVEFYNSNFEKIGQENVVIYKPSKRGSGFIIHQASYHPSK